MAMTLRRVENFHGPALAGIPFRERSQGKAIPLLDARAQAALAPVSSLMTFRKGHVLYLEGGATDSLYNIVQGVAKTFKLLPDKRSRISSFLFPGDLCGNSEEGRYADTAAAVVTVVAYRISLVDFDELLRKDADLAMRVVTKLWHDLRQRDRHAVLLGRNDALGKIAMFVQLLERVQSMRIGRAPAVFVPMSRSDVADYVGLSLEAVSRAFRTLEDHGIVRFVERRHFQVLDRARLKSLVEGQGLSDEPQGEANAAANGASADAVASKREAIPARIGRA